MFACVVYELCIILHAGKQAWEIANQLVLGC